MEVVPGVGEPRDPSPLDEGVVFHPVWSEWTWVRITSSTSSSITPSAASSSGSLPPTPSHRPKAESAGPTPVSIKVRPVGIRTRKQWSRNRQASAAKSSGYLAARDSDPPGGGSPLPSNTSAIGIDVSTSRIAVISTFPTVSVAAGIEETYPSAAHIGAQRPTMCSGSVR
jgi:hypothetical protein